MARKLGLLAFVFSLTLLGANQSAEAGGYFYSGYYAPAAVYPVAAPVNVVYPVTYTPVYQAAYYAPTPVYAYQPVYTTPAPVYVAPVGYSHVTARVTPVQYNYRVRSYGVFPYRKSFYSEKWTPRGVVIRHRGF